VLVVLATVNVNGTPELVGVSVAGEKLHVGGAGEVQLRLTEWLYPPNAVSTPLKIPF
jgi:hypothetical protein